LSDKPEGVENYDMRPLAGDVAAVIKSLGKDKAIIVGHDWGGVGAWQFAMNVPQMSDQLIFLNLPHPRGIAHELAKPDSQQAKNAAYAPDVPAGKARNTKLTAEALAGWVKDPKRRRSTLRPSNDRASPPC
jgi:pimeloyl-ACP methyl ester carboxylesterase